MAKHRRRVAAIPDLGAPDHPRTRHDAIVRNTGIILVTAALFSSFWFGRMDWEPGMRAWRAFGDASIVLLFGSLSLGPLAKLSRQSARLLPWRRELGIWCAVMAVAHTILVLVWWVKWDFARLLGYEFIPELGRTARMEPGFGLANLMGLVALIWALVLAVTSSNRAVKLLGSPAWKWLHHGAYVLFYLTVLHTVYFLFLHYTKSFHRDVPEPNWFRWPLVALGLCVLGLQYAAFTKTVRRRHAGTRKR